MDKLNEYTFRVENEKFVLEYIYLAYDSYSGQKTTNADIKVRLLKQPNPLVPFLPYELIWEKLFLNQILRPSPYYPFEFGFVGDEHVFFIVENRLIKAQLIKGDIVFEKAIGNTPLVKVDSYNQNIIVLSSFDGFDLTRHTNNLRMVDCDGETVWIAELASDIEHLNSYCDFKIRDGKFEAWSGSFYMTLDFVTGKKMSVQFVK